jgi:hypothetical protein
MGFWRACSKKMVKNFGGFGILLGKHKIKRNYGFMNCYIQPVSAMFELMTSLGV